MREKKKQKKTNFVLLNQNFGAAPVSKNVQRIMHGILKPHPYSCSHNFNDEEQGGLKVAVRLPKSEWSQGQVMSDYMRPITLSGTDQYVCNKN